MGTSTISFWNCMANFIHHHRGDVWNRVLQGLHRPVAPHGCTAFCTQPHFQFLFHLFSIWAQEQPPRIHRHPPRPSHSSLGTLCSLSILPHQPHRNRRPQPRLDHLRQHPVCFVGMYCDGVTIECNLDE